MRQSKKHHDMEHKHPKCFKKKEAVGNKLNKPIKGNPNEQDWQLEERKLKERHKNRLS
ncbi:MAG: hypothetical protein S4CHLAM6_04870 [Chlamydiae bacterium]|nr:hypothetical protein [Chlamydiota bacterium]